MPHIQHPAIDFGAVMGAAMQPARDRCERFCARLDTHLATLPDDAARRAFCHAQERHWITLYEQWAHAVDSGRLDVKTGDATAWDYQLTISAIGTRKGRYAPAPAVTA